MNKLYFETSLLAVGVLLFASCAKSDAEDDVTPTEVYSCSYMEATPGNTVLPEDNYNFEFMNEVPCSEEKIEDEERKSSYTTTSIYHFSLSICGNKSVLETSRDDETSTNYKIYNRTRLTYSEGRYNTCNGLYTVVVSRDEIKAKYSEHDDSELRLIYKLDNYQRIKSTETNEIVNRVTNETTSNRYICNDGSLHFSSGEYEYIAEPVKNGYVLRQLKPEEHEYELEK